MNLKKRSHTITLAAASAVAAMMLALTGCSADAPSTPDVEIPTDGAGTAMQLVLDELNQKADTTPAAWEGVTAPAFQDELDADALAGAMNNELRDDAPFEVLDYSETDGIAKTKVEGQSGTQYVLSVSVDADSLITGLFLRPAA
ncbi:hypothetical protein U746_0877 [Mycolicibacterium mucogenicum 261Sha1.1M5]|nr:hypothetical protein U746_0877 [Mycolicibacterium mucogenicum 261Sha1.1M5]